MTEAFEEDGAHDLFIGTRRVIGQIHKRRIVVLHLIVERHLADIDLMFQITIQIGSLLIMDRHTLLGMTLRIFEETGPEHLNILLPKCSNQRHLLEEFVVAMTFCKSFHDKLLGHHLVCTQKITTGHQMEDRGELGFGLQQIGMTDKTLILLGPSLVIACMFQ